VRALGIDLGERRIGIAVSSGSVASPVETVQRSGDRARDHRRILELADEWETDVLVVGLPLSLDGSVGPAAVAVLAEVEELRAGTSIAVETYDERFTTVTAERQLRELGVPGRDRRRMIDQVAAAVFLQAWLDGRSDAVASTENPATSDRDNQ
jgi:putative Holliday junction resolvase